MYYVCVCKRKISGEMYASSFHSHLPLKHKNVAMFKKKATLFYILPFLRFAWHSFTGLAIVSV